MSSRPQWALEKQQADAEYAAMLKAAKMDAIVNKTKLFLHRKITELKEKREEEVKQNNLRRATQSEEAKKVQMESQVYQDAAQAARQKKVQEERAKKREAKARVKAEKIAEAERKRFEDAKEIESAKKEARELREKAQEVEKAEQDKLWAETHFVKAPLGKDCPVGWGPIVDKDLCVRAAKTLGQTNDFPDFDFKKSWQKHPAGCFLNTLNHHIDFNNGAGHLNPDDERFCSKMSETGATPEELKELNAAVQAAQAEAMFLKINAAMEHEREAEEKERAEAEQRHQERMMKRGVISFQKQDKSDIVSGELAEETRENQDKQMKEEATRREEAERLAKELREAPGMKAVMKESLKWFKGSETIDEILKQPLTSGNNTFEMRVLRSALEEVAADDSNITKEVTLGGIFPSNFQVNGSKSNESRRSSKFAKYFAKDPQWFVEDEADAPARRPLWLSKEGEAKAEAPKEDAVATESNELTKKATFSATKWGVTKKAQDTQFRQTASHVADDGIDRTNEDHEMRTTVPPKDNKIRMTV